jgi:hypothetical protein
MRPARRVRVAAAITAGSILAACSGDKSTSPSTSSVSLTQALSEMSRPELGALGTIAIGTSVPVGPTLVPSDCAYQSSAQTFTCAPVTVGGVSVTRSYALLTLGGAPQSQYDPTSTDGVRTNTHVKGTLTESGSTFTIDDQRELVLTGLLSSTHVLNGTSVTHVDGTLAGTGTPVSSSSTVTTKIANLTLPTGAKYPTSGTITTDVAEQFASLPQYTMHIVATFDGSSTLSVAMTSGIGTTRCSIDLSGTAKPSCA